MSELMKTVGIRKKNIIHGIDFLMNEGEMVAIMGPSGSGKSTLLYLLSRMEHADSGNIYFMGEDITKYTEDESASMRLRKMGFVFQQMNMLSNLNIIDNIILPAMQCERKGKTKTRSTETVLKEKARHLMQKMRIEALADRRITELSGGQLQRACICRALMNEPKLLLADEPTGALNRGASKEVMDEFIRMNREGMSTLIVTHDSKVASVCDRILYLVDGSIAGECILGKYQDCNHQKREMQLADWLDERQW